MDIPREDFSKPPAGKHFQRYLDFAGSIIFKYNGIVPFHLYLRKYFSSNKKHGSKDRKQIIALCYNYFRLGLGVNASYSMLDKFLLGIFLCESNPSSMLALFKPQWNEEISNELIDKIKIVENDFDSKNIFPFSSELSDELDKEKFSLSFLQQPKLFVRIRPGKEYIVLEKIRSAKFSFKKINDMCLAFSQNEKVTDVIRIDKDAVIQDYNSQRVGEFLPKKFFSTHALTTVWDCCAGSGGKSILAVDVLDTIKLTVTDKRLTILQNLKNRFASAGIKNFDPYVLDIASDRHFPTAESFDIIIADVPCSGSDTWSRTPEQLQLFRSKEIERYASLQKKIIKNILPHLEQNGILLYITCSVFKKENEENVDYIVENFQLKLLKMEYLKGYEMQANTLFIAVFSNSP